MRGSTSVPLSSLDTGQVKPEYGIALWLSYLVSSTPSHSNQAHVGFNKTPRGITCEIEYHYPYLHSTQNRNMALSYLVKGNMTFYTITNQPIPCRLPSVALSSPDTGQVYGTVFCSVIGLCTCSLHHNKPTNPMSASMKPRGESHAG